MNDIFAYDFAYSTEKIRQSDILGKDKEGEIYLAKNEREGIQLAIYDRYNRDYASLVVSEFKNENGEILKSDVYFENFMSVGDSSDYFFGMYPDALIPYDGKEIQFTWHNNRVFYIEVISTEDTTPGEYTATVELKNEGKTFFETKITAKVWNFTMPKKPATKTAVGIFSENFFELNGLNDNSYYGVNGGQVTIKDAQSEIYKKYYDTLLEHGISAYSLPYDILDSRADAYMSDERVTSFIIPYTENDELLVRYYEKVSSNPEWAKKGMFYPIDEPDSVSEIKSYNKITDRLARLCPGYNMITPFYGIELVDQDGTGTIINNFDVQSGRTNRLCPETVCYSDKEFFDNMKKRTSLGDEAWWYVCCGPKDSTGYCNMFTFQDGIKHRLLFWQQKQYDVKGFLYWDTCFWSKAKNPWSTSVTWDTADASGDGCWIYPGKYIGVDGPITSLRLKNVANGIEDYTLLAMAEEKFGREWVDSQISKVSKDLTHYTLSDKEFNAVRIAIGNALAKG